jgi:vacuolar protein sorting-associated protein 13A/C
VVVELDRIFILAEPSTNVEGGDADSVQEAKNSHVRVGLSKCNICMTPK